MAPEPLKRVRITLIDGQYLDGTQPEPPAGQGDLTLYGFGMPDADGEVQVIGFPKALIASIEPIT